MALEEEVRETNELLREFVRSSGGGVRRYGGSAGAPSPFAGSFDDIASATVGLKGSLYGVASFSTKAAKTLLGFGESAQDASTALKSLFSGTVFGGLAAIVANTFDVYKQFIGIGQNFNGQMINLSVIASTTGQSMTQLLEGFKSAGTAGAVLGVERFGKLSHQIRNSTREFGSFGLTMEETNAYLGDYLETSRTLGVLESTSTHQTINNFNDLQNQTLALSAATGKSRDEILKQTLAMQKNNAILTGALAGLPESVRSGVQQSLQGAINVFSALPGQTGQVLTDALTSSMSLGSAFMNQQFGEIAVMASGVGTAIDEVSKAAQAGGDATGAALTAVEAIQGISGEQLKQMSMLAETGHQASKEFLTMYSSVKSINVDNLREQIKQKQRFAGVETEFLNFQQNVASIGGELRGTLLKFFQPLILRFNGLSGDGGLLSKFSDWLRKLGASDKFGEWGEAFANFVEGLIPTREEFTKLKESISNTIVSFGQWIGLLDKDGKFDWKGFKEGLVKAKDAVVEILIGFKQAMASLILWVDSLLSKLGAGFLSEESKKSLSAAGVGADVATFEKNQGLANALLQTYQTQVKPLEKGGFLGYDLSDAQKSSRLTQLKIGEQNLEKNVDSLVKVFVEDGKISQSEQKELKRIAEENTKLFKMIDEKLKIQISEQQKNNDLAQGQYTASKAGVAAVKEQNK